MKHQINIPCEKTVLVVEDNHDRNEWFREHLGGLRFTIAASPQRAENVLGAHRFDIVFLDHDAVPVFVDPTDPDFQSKTFFRIAEILAKTHYDGIVVIHSQNPVGAQRMKYMLGRDATVHVMPFGTFDVTVGCQRD